jgi:hypothetical protein
MSEYNRYGTSDQLVDLPQRLVCRCVRIRDPAPCQRRIFGPGASQALPDHGRRSFYSDQTFMIRQTSEDRAAVAIHSELR